MTNLNPIHFIRLSLCCLLTASACQRKEDASSLDSPLSPIEREYTQLQQDYRALQTQVTQLQQQNQAFKASENASIEQDQAISQQLAQTQKNLNALQREYQALQQDYASLKNSISPLNQSLKTLTDAFRGNLIGTKLGTVVLKNGRQLQQCTIIQVTDDTLRVKYDSGWVNISYDQLTPELQKRFFPAPVLVSSVDLLGEKTTPPAKPLTSTTAQKPSVSLLEKAFIQRQRRELEQYHRSIPPKIKHLETKITRAHQQIASLKKERIKTSQYYRKRSGSIKRSSVDLDRALKKINGDIRKLSLAIQVANTQIESWKKELQ